MRRLFGAGRGTSDETAWAPTVCAQEGTPVGDLIYRLKAWPELPETERTADIYRIFSVMSQRPVSRHWILARSRMAPDRLEHLLQLLEAEGVLEVIDPARFAGRDAMQS
ncbi:MAG: hypothetical protein EOO24_16195 [Comamonadaceae bacterium]|nr:MAG: hypothetical protein EOO24_16195 [Comamonadaceae bacterium]